MTVLRRHVLFLAGFDPKGASWYHRIYRTQAQAQARLTGAHYEVSPRRHGEAGNDCWTVQAGPPGSAAVVHTTIEHLRWDDLVRSQWARNSGAVLRASVAAYAAMLSAGTALWRVGRVSPRTLFSLGYPLVFWMLPLLLCIAVWLAWGAVAGTIALVMALVIASRLERRLNTSWLLQIFAFTQRWAAGRVAGLEDRLKVFGNRLTQLAADPQIDEVLVVGYSVGSMLAISAVADALARHEHADHPTTGRPQARLSLVTLGQCIPLLALLPRAKAFRESLQRVALAPNLTWVDISSPTDWGSFALVDPVSLCLDLTTAVNPAALLSPRFHMLFEPDTYERLRKDKRRVHLQYLMAGERAGGYDYFDLTAGALRLDERDWSALRPKA